jgi:hypothetical protein
MDAGGLEARDWAAGEDLPSRCPALLYEPVGTVARTELDKRAAGLVQAAPPMVAPAPTAEPTPASPRDTPKKP